MLTSIILVIYFIKNPATNFIDTYCRMVQYTMRFEQEVTKWSAYVGSHWSADVGSRGLNGRGDRHGNFLSLHNFQHSM